jgi:hypothetical protein
MKRVKMKFLVYDSYTKEDFKFSNAGVLELEEWSESKISKDLNIVQAYSFEELWESTMLFGTGIWHAARGFYGMLGWSITVIIEGFKWLWENGAGKKKETQHEAREVDKGISGKSR